MRRIINMILARVTSFLLIVMTVLVMWQVFTRYALSNPSVFTEELVRIILIWTALLGAAYAFGTKQHMSLIFVKDGLKGNSKKAISIFIDAVVLFFAAIVMVNGGVRVAASAAGIQTPVMGISKALVYSIAPLSGVLIIILQAMNLYEDFVERV